MSDKSIFDYSVKLISEDGDIFDTDGISISVDTTDDPEQDRDTAREIADCWAEEQADNQDAWEYELNLEDVG